MSFLSVAKPRPLCPDHDGMIVVVVGAIFVLSDLCKIQKLHKTILRFFWVFRIRPLVYYYRAWPWQSLRLSSLVAEQLALGEHKLKSRAGPLV